MVRAGVVNHPSQWPFSGYNEIQEPRRKCALIDYQRLSELLDVETYDLVKLYHKKWVEEHLGNGDIVHDDKWTMSIAVGCRDFIERVKSVLGTRAMGRKIRDAAKSYQLREPSVPYGDHFGGKNGDIGVENAYFWETNPE